VGTTASGTCGERVIWAIGTTYLTVTLTATPAAGSEVCYGGAGCYPEGDPLQVGFTVSNGDAHTALFEFRNTTRMLAASVSGTGQGTIVGGTASINCPTTCNSVLPYGWQGDLTATASQGSVFKKWTGACAGQGPTCMLDVTADTTIAAEFDLAVASSPTTSAKSKPVATALPTSTGQPSASAIVIATGSASETTPSPSDQVLSETAVPTPAVSGAAASDPTTGSGSGSIPWLPVIVLVIVAALAVNVLAFQVLRARRPRP
jgi:hypothetical protein